MKILVQGLVPEAELPVELACHRCSSVLEAELEDLHLGIYTSSEDSYGDTQTPGAFAICPLCTEAGVKNAQVRYRGVSGEVLQELRRLPEKTLSA